MKKYEFIESTYILSVLQQKTQMNSKDSLSSYSIWCYPYIFIIYCLKKLAQNSSILITFIHTSKAYVILTENSCRGSNLQSQKI